MDREVVIFIAYPLNPFTQVQSQQIRKEAVYGYSIKLPPGLLYNYYRTPNFSCFFQKVFPKSQGFSPLIRRETQPIIILL